ncbi:hypothetical protein DPMN_103393 [Dreissena polymorpha]|uniref:Uncharacterized protein n=1 Tax=Dreissena polymorpha TaxID=45954 RepID=A0A9D4H7Z2_DREPO|nr:hypothetical protein DPMN_103393 [Dreissena polymorpha]
MENHLEYLTASMICYDPPFSEEIDVKRAVFETENCSIVFVTDPDIPYDFNEKSCWTSIDRCNITGRWDKYDSELEDACHKYHSVIRFPMNNLRFQNVFCFLCNGLEVIQFQKKCGLTQAKPYSFSGLLKIYTPATTASNGNTSSQREVRE